MYRAFSRLMKFKWHITEARMSTYFPHVVPHETFSCEHLTLSTIFFPQAHCLLVRYGHGGQRVGSSWHACDAFGWPHSGGGREQGYPHAILVPQGIGGSSTVRPQWHTI